MAGSGNLKILPKYPREIEYSDSSVQHTQAVLEASGTPRRAALAIPNCKAHQAANLRVSQRSSTPWSKNDSSLMRPLLATTLRAMFSRTATSSLQVEVRTPAQQLNILLVLSATL